MKKYSSKSGPLCLTSEKRESFAAHLEVKQIQNDISARIVEAFDFQPDSEIAFILGTSCKAVRLFTEGNRLPSSKMLLRIHKTTGISIHWLLTGEGSKYPVAVPMSVPGETTILGLA